MIFTKNEIIWEKINEFSEAIRPIEYLASEALLHYDYCRDFEGLALHEVLALGETLHVLAAHFCSTTSEEVVA